MQDNTTPEGIPIPDFTPWYPRHARTGGWTADVQRAFIAALTRIGSVGAAARAVGMSRRGAGLLREKEGAEGFSAAWEEAVARGRDHAQSVAINRALHGDIVPQFRNGGFIGYKTLHNDRLLIAAVSGGQGAVVKRDERDRLSEMRYRLERWEAALRREQMALDGDGAEPAAAAGEAWEDHLTWQREMKRETRRQRNVEIRAAVRKSTARAERVGPRIRLL
jgi:hypothetical protein